jgi:hypothetical protein
MAETGPAGTSQGSTRAQWCPDTVVAIAERAPVAEQRRTSTSSFGIGRRESHDASQFYAPFRPPEIDDDENVACAPDLGDGSIEVTSASATTFRTARSR